MVAEKHQKAVGTYADGADQVMSGPVTTIHKRVFRIFGVTIAATLGQNLTTGCMEINTDIAFKF